MTSSDHKKFILETYKSDHDLLGLSAVDCGSILTDDCKMLQLYIGDNPESYSFGEMYGCFEYNNDLYSFSWHIHEPNQKLASLSNRMTNFSKLVVKTKSFDYVAKTKSFDYVAEEMADSGHKAFWLYTPDSHLDGFDLSLRLFMKKIKEYAVSEQLCKKIRRLDHKYLAWKVNLRCND